MFIACALVCVDACFVVCDMLMPVVCDCDVVQVVYVVDVLCNIEVIA